MARRPNILFLLNDHQAYYRHGWEQGPKIQRPHFDRLAAGGIEFNRAYTSCPLCGPARRTMLTGLLPHNHGEVQNDTNHPFDRTTYLDVLGQNGYRNFYYGKWHAGPGTAHDHQCEGFNYPSYGNPYITPEYKTYCEERGLPEARHRLEYVFEHPLSQSTAKVGEEYSSQRPWCNDCVTGVTVTPKETHESFFLANLVCDKLRELAADDSDEPFSMRVDFWGPHIPYFATQEFADLYNPEDIPEYPSFAEDLSNKPSLYREEKYPPLCSATEWIEGKPGIGWLIQPNPIPWRDWQRVIRMSYAQTSMIDAAGGQILDTLEELGLDDNTLVVWTTDHGDALASHGGHLDKQSYMCEEVMRIPMALRMPGKVAPRQVRQELVSNIDLAPTFLDAAGVAFDEPVDGRSLLRLDDAWREDLMSETHGHMEDHLGRMVVTDRFKYIANRDDMDELYDLKSDSYEMNNLIDNPDYAKQLADLKARLAAWQKQTQDECKIS